MEQDLQKRLQEEYLDNEDILWSSSSLKVKDSTMYVWTFKFPNNWGVIIRRILKDSGNIEEYEGYADNIYFHDDYYFDRPKGNNQLKDKPFYSLSELINILDIYRSLPNYESK